MTFLIFGQSKTDMAKFAIFTEGSLRGGVDTFLRNLIGSWTKDDDLTLLLNHNYIGLAGFNDIDCSNSKVRLWKNFLMIFYRRNYPEKFGARIIRLIYRILYYPILTPIVFIQLFCHFKRSDYEYLLVVNGGHPGSLYCRVAAIAWAASKSSKTCVYSVHNVPKKPPQFAEYIESCFDALLSRSCKKLVTVSKSAANEFESTAGHFKSWKLSYIHNGIKDIAIETSLLAKSMKAPETFIDLPNPYILILATFEPRKGHKFLLDAFREVLKSRPDATLLMMGDGTKEQISEIKDYVTRLGLDQHVQILPFSDDPYFYLEYAAVCVSASQESEPFGLTLIEAMALSTPLVITDVGGMPEVVSDSGAARICNKDDKSKFARYILVYLNSKTERQLSGALGRKHFLKHFTADIMTKKYKQLYEVNFD